VRVALVRFGPQPGGEVSLVGRFVVLSPQSERVLLTREVELRRDPGQADTGHAVEAMSALVADLAAQIADAIGALPSDMAEKAPGAPTPAPR
jgi:uncharacterized lipoprotein YmbA